MQVSTTYINYSPQVVVTVSTTVKINSMIFKTFNSDIDKISSKWGMFGRSFNDIGNAIIGRITVNGR